MTPACPQSFPVNEVAELVADLIEATGLVSADRLAPSAGASSRAAPSPRRFSTRASPRRRGSPARSPSRFHLPFVDLPVHGVDDEAAKEIPVHVLERVVAIPYALEGDMLRIAIADPGNVHAIDELRLATRFQLELAVASQDDIENEIRRLARASEAFGARAAIDEEDALVDEERRSRATTSRSTTASPTSRSSGSSTRSSSRQPRTGPATSTSSRRRTRSSSACASTACCTRCSGSPSG